MNKPTFFYLKFVLFLSALSVLTTFPCLVKAGQLDQCDLSELKLTALNRASSIQFSLELLELIDQEKNDEIRSLIISHLNNDIEVGKSAMLMLIDEQDQSRFDALIEDISTRKDNNFDIRSTDALPQEYRNLFGDEEMALLYALIQAERHKRTE